MAVVSSLIGDTEAKNPKVTLYVFGPKTNGDYFNVKVSTSTDPTFKVYEGKDEILTTEEGRYRPFYETYRFSKFDLGNQTEITFDCVNAYTGGYVCWSIAGTFDIVLGEKATSELGYVGGQTEFDREYLKLRVRSTNTANRVSIAVYPLFFVPFWLKTNRLQELRIGPSENESIVFRVSKVDKYDFTPCFFSYEAAQKGIVFWFVSCEKDPNTGLPYPDVQYAYNKDVGHAYPTTVDLRQKSRIDYNEYGEFSQDNTLVSFDQFAKGLRIQPSPIRSGLMFPLWIYAVGLASNEQWNYNPANYESKIYIPSAAFERRTIVPEPGNKYYTTKSGGGWSPCIPGNAKHKASSSGGVNYPAGRLWANSTLPNCVGYATGRFNEIGRWGECRYLGNRNATDFVNFLKPQGLTLSQTPSLGACLVWGGTKDSTKEGHVAICEAINEDGSIDISESGWYSTPHFRYRRVTKDGMAGKWGMSGSFYFKGFIANPGANNYNIFSDAYLAEAFEPYGGPQVSREEGPTYDIQPGQYTDGEYVYVTPKQEIGSVSDVHGLQLLTTPTLVESPFIEATIGKYTFGSYTRTGTVESQYAEQRVQYPNYMESLNITKINGAVNQYILTMKYQIQAGEDPNFMDKVFSSVSDSRKIMLTYGDWNAPQFVYRNEEAIITKVTSNVDFQQSCITYTVYCTSSALSLKSKVYDFPSYNDKPSNIIRNFLKNNSYGLLDIFYGMKNNLDKALSMIASDDKKVNIKSQENVDILTYLNYLVACMISNSNQNVTIQDAMYNLIIRDEITGDFEGPYFKVVKVNATSRTLTSTNIYEVDIGFPGETIVTDFRINNDNSWAILYNYDGAINPEQYVYRIDNEGRMRTEYSPNITTSDYYRQTTAANKTWWTRMTQFPITATLTIKGLIRPAMLMEQVRINAYFFGQRHISSGLYVITKQQDTLNSSGYKTTLTLLRIAGDEDKLYDVKQTNVSGTTLPDVHTIVEESGDVFHTTSGSVNNGNSQRVYTSTIDNTLGTLW